MKSTTTNTGIRLLIVTLASTVLLLALLRFPAMAATGQLALTADVVEALDLGVDGQSVLPLAYQFIARSTVDRQPEARCSACAAFRRAPRFHRKLPLPRDSDSSSDH